MLKISPINGLNHFSVKKNEKQSNITTNPITTSSNPTEVFTSGVPRSYINFKGKIEDEFKFGEDAKQLINRAKKIAIDMPSGICADDGAVLGNGFKADVTITFSFAIKPVTADTPNTQPFSFKFLPNPSGVKIGWINFPIPAKIESPASK